MIGTPNDPSMATKDSGVPVADGGLHRNKPSGCRRGKLDGGGNEC